MPPISLQTYAGTGGGDGTPVAANPYPMALGMPPATGLEGAREIPSKARASEEQLAFRSIPGETTVQRGDPDSTSMGHASGDPSQELAPFGAPRSYHPEGGSLVRAM